MRAVVGSPAIAAARYIAPVSRYVKPSAAATARATVDLPAPAGPSIATSIRLRVVLRHPAPPVSAARAIALVFFSNGLLLGAWAARIPALREDLSLSDGELGIVLALVA